MSDNYTAILEKAENTKKKVEQFSDLLDSLESTEDKKKIEDDVANLKTVMESGDTEAVKEKIKTLTESAMKLGEAIYKQQQQAETTSNEPEKKDEVVDAEYQEVDKDKKE